MVEGNVIQINDARTIKCQCECKKHNTCEKDYIWNTAACSCKNGKYLAIIMDDTAITYYEIIESLGILTNCNEKKATYKTQIFTCVFINYYKIIDSY